MENEQTLTDEPETQTTRGRQRARALLAQLEEVSRFFSSTTSLAQAVGVTRDTILAWKRGDTSRVRLANELRVGQLLQVCLAAADHLPEDELVGRWMQAPQTFLYGGTPIEFLADGGDPAVLIESMEPPVATVNERALAALAAADDELAELVDPKRRRERAPAAAVDATPGEVIDLMEALRRSVAHEQALRSRRPGKGARIVTAPRREGGWVNIIDGGVVVPSLWRTKREAVKAAKKLAATAGVSQVSLDVEGRETERPPARTGRVAGASSRERSQR